MADSETPSVSASLDNQEDPLVDLDNEQIFQLLEEILHSNEILTAETQMFEKYLKRVETKDTLGALGLGTQLSSTPLLSTNDMVGVGGVRVGRKRSKSKAGNLDKMLKLSAEQKCDIAQREIEEFKEEIEKLHEESEKVIDTLKAIMEEADLRLSEIKKTSYEFDRDIVKGAGKTQTGKVISEKVLRYFEDNLRSRDSLIEKLRLKNSTLKVQKKKLHLQLKQKEEMGEILHEVDFNQLKIENRQYIEKIDERNQDLLRLKLMAANTLQVLNTYKKRLHTLTMESDRLKNEITSRGDLLSKIDTENVQVEEDRQIAEKLNRKLRQQLSDYRVPNVMEYVGVKADLYELQKKVKSWERKVEIADMAFKKHQKAWKQILVSNQPVH